MSLDTHVSFVPKLLPMPTQFLIIIYRLRRFKLIKEMSLVDWDPNFHIRSLLHRCKVSLLIIQ
jgi:hypothetical protein